MRDAMEAASSGQVSRNRVADMYGVPKSTLKDRLSGCILHGSKLGPKPYLHPSEERELKEHPITHRHGTTLNQERSATNCTECCHR